MMQCVSHCMRKHLRTLIIAFVARPKKMADAVDVVVGVDPAVEGGDAQPNDQPATEEPVVTEAPSSPGVPIPTSVIVR